MESLCSEGRRKHDTGFTLVELMVVVLIIGILALVAVGSYQALSARASQAACLANQRTLYDAMNVYRARNGGSVPTTTTVDFLSDYANTWEFISVCPLDKSPLTFDPTTTSIICPNHPFP